MLTRRERALSTGLLAVTVVLGAVAVHELRARPSAAPCSTQLQIQVGDGLEFGAPYTLDIIASDAVAHCQSGASAAGLAALTCREYPAAMSYAPEMSRVTIPTSAAEVSIRITRDGSTLLKIVHPDYPRSGGVHPEACSPAQVYVSLPVR